jgi:hypothetical protein
VAPAKDVSTGKHPELVARVGDLPEESRRSEIIAAAFYTTYRFRLVARLNNLGLRRRRANYMAATYFGRK